MKRPLVFKHRTLVAVFAVLWLMSGSTIAKETVRLTNGEWLPYQSEKLVGYGPASVLMTRAFRKSGVDVEYGFYPWNRAVRLVERGAWDGTFMWVLTEERQRKFLVSDPLFSIREVIFYSKDRPVKGEFPADLNGLVMGAIDASAFGEQFNELIESGAITVARVRNNKQLFQMLHLGRVDFIPELETSGYEAIQEYLTPEERERITHLETLSFPWTYHLLLSRFTDNGPYFLKAFNNGLQQLKDSGEFETIMGPYIRPKLK